MASELIRVGSVGRGTEQPIHSSTHALRKPHDHGSRLGLDQRSVPDVSRRAVSRPRGHGEHGDRRRPDRDTRDDSDEICETIRGYDSVTGLTVFESGAALSRVQVETTVPLLLTSLQDSGVPLEMPFEVRDGEMSLEVTVPQETLSGLAETLDEFGIQYTVERIQQEVASDPLLTERQRRILDEAIDRGYYDTPRRITLVDLAEELDIAKSTCSETLHRAEERVVKDYRSDERDLPPEIAATSD